MIEKKTDIFVKMKNPYTFGVPVRGEDIFFGRDKELRVIFDTLENVPIGQKQDLVIMGPRRIGKSSLLYQLVDLLTPNRDFVPVYIDIQNINPRKTRILFIKILKEIKDKYIKQCSPVELPQFETLESNKIHEDLQFLTFDEDMGRLNDLIKLRDLPRLVLIFDEVELLVDFGGQSTLEWFRSLIQSMFYTIFVVAGSERLYSLTQDHGSPFYNIFKTVELYPLSQDAAEQLFKVPATNIGLKYSQAEVIEILRYAGNNPYFIQGIAHYLVVELNSQKRCRAYMEDVKKIIEECITHFSSQFSYFWDRISQEQKVIIFALAKDGYPRSADYLITKLPQLEISKQELQDSFDGLVREQILKIEDGNYWFTALLFADWILSNVDDEEVIKLGTLRETANESASEYNLKAIRQFLTDAFTYDELKIMTFDYFYPLHDSYSGSMSKSVIIQLLIEYVMRHGLVDKLLQVAKEANPYRYELFQKDIYQ